MLLSEIVKRLSSGRVKSKSELASELGVTIVELEEALDMLLHLGKIEVVSCDGGNVTLCENCPDKSGCASNSETPSLKTTAYKIKPKLK